MFGHRAQINRRPQAQCAPERLAAYCLFEALGHCVHPGAATRHPVSQVGNQHDHTLRVRR